MAKRSPTTAASPTGTEPALGIEGGPGSNLPEYRVSELAGAVKRTVEHGFGHVRVRGEVSQPKRHSSGHLYLRLKDESAVLEAVCWRATAARLAVRPEEGMEVVCTGRLTTYPARSQYQLVIEAVALAGEGALLKLLEERRKRLAEEGLFDGARKRKVPYLPTIIGVVTSPTGAVIRDILHRLADRFPLRVLMWPVAVQGEAAAAQIAAAIEGFNALPPDGPVPRPDTLIVARGGGSLEDLMPFNEEVVVRAVAASTIPLISAVGHETDTTLIDHAADLRAPTPTAAAELAVPVRAELQAGLLDQERRRVAAMGRLLGEKRLRVDSLARGLGDPKRLLESAMQRLDDRAERLERALPVVLAERRGRLAEAGARLRHPRQLLAAANQQVGQLSDRLHAAGQRLVPRSAERLSPVSGRLQPAAARRLADASARLKATGKLLESYSYRDVVRRGFVVVRDDDGAPVMDGAGLNPGAALTLEFRDADRVAVTVDGAGQPAMSSGKPEKAKRAARGRIDRSGGKPDQGSLF